MNWRAIGKGISISTIVVLLTVSAYFANDALKVKNPADPRYNPDRFSFNDNRTDRIKKANAFRVLFPPGTPKEFVDRVLVDAGGADTMKIATDRNLWRYMEPKLWWHPIGFAWPHGPHHNFLFDEQDRVINVTFYLTEKLFEEKNKKEEK